MRLERLGWTSSLVALALIACGEPGEPPTFPPFALVGADAPADFRAVDLTHPFDAETLYWPTSPSTFVLERLAYGHTEAGYFYSANAFCAPEHGGTHLDAPIHFAEDRWGADEVPLERLIGPGVVIDVSAQAAVDSDYRLTVKDVLAWEREHGRIPPATIVLLRTGWDRFWPDRVRYFGEAPEVESVLGEVDAGTPPSLSFPSYGEEAARLLVEERRVAVLGVDTASIDYGRSQDFIVHQVANGANVPGLENVANLERVPATGAWILALPMKIRGGSGGPVRIVALLPGS